VAARFAGRYREDVREGAPTEIWQALPNFQAGARFEGWCYAVLYNRFVDQLRKEQREQTLRANLAVESEASGHLQRVLEQTLDNRERLSDVDLNSVEGWPLAQRLVLLSLTALWTKVPRETWSAWVADYRARPDCSLSDPFPPDRLQDCESAAERNEVLAEATGLPRNRLAVWLFRYKPRLRNLRYIRALLDNA
jgi:hypothetical protein